MKENIHPAYTEISVTCNCGSTFKTRSTAGQDLNLDVSTGMPHDPASIDLRARGGELDGDAILVHRDDVSRSL